MGNYTYIVDEPVYIYKEICKGHDKSRIKCSHLLQSIHVV